MKYKVGYIRSQGIECKWTKDSSGSPYIVGRCGKNNDVWSPIDADIWKRAEKVGLKQAFEEATTLIDWFNVPTRKVQSATA